MKLKVGSSTLSKFVVPVLEFVYLRVGVMPVSFVGMTG